MSFKRILPVKQLEAFVECYWVVESESSEPFIQKIIPDGFAEIIFHYKDPYLININGDWEVQSKNLLAGQIKKHFFLKNTGASGVFGIKFKPAALKQLFNIQIKEFTDKVISIPEVKNDFLNKLDKEISREADHNKMIAIAERHLLQKTESLLKRNTNIENAIKLIRESNGSISIAEISKQLFISERVLQRLFSEYVGLSPKTYARIIRFNYIFELMKKEAISWSAITYHSGYFDQSHFIKNFRSFTGEDPSAYLFEQENMANFFLKKE